MRILTLITGEYGQRHVDNLKQHAPGSWTIAVWQTPRALPIVLDYPEEYLPESLEPADLILSLAELPGVRVFGDVHCGATGHGPVRVGKRIHVHPVARGAACDAGGSDHQDHPPRFHLMPLSQKLVLACLSCLP